MTGEALKGFFEKYKAELAVVVLCIYVLVLGLATISEIFDLGWFTWLTRL